MVQKYFKENFKQSHYQVYLDNNQLDLGAKKTQINVKDEVKLEERHFRRRTDDRGRNDRREY